MNFGKRLRNPFKGPSSKKGEGGGPQQHNKNGSIGNRSNGNSNRNSNCNSNCISNCNSNSSVDIHLPSSSQLLNGESSPLLVQLEALHEVLRGIENESQLASKHEYAACRVVHKDLQRILGLRNIAKQEAAPPPPIPKESDHFSAAVDKAAATGGGTPDKVIEESKSSEPIPIGKQSRWDSRKFVPASFRVRFDQLQREVERADEASQAFLRGHPAATRPLSPDALQSLSEFFVLDNSLRETTVGAPRGHTLEEKHKIVASLAKTSLREVVLGAYGSKISVCSQLAEQWQSLGKSFDHTWGFSECFDLEPFDEDGFWDHGVENGPTSPSGNLGGRSSWMSDSQKSAQMHDYYTPEHIVKTSYSAEDLALMKKASSGFRRRAFGRSRSLAEVLKKSSSKDGRIPLGLLMMKGYGICNAILEIDTSIETFDYEKYNIFERLRFLIGWCKENLAKRSNGEPTRVLINLRDFSNYHRSRGGLQNCLYLVDALCRLPLDHRPFGFMIEEPTGWLFPSEVGQICRMLRLTMDRAGFSEAKFLIHSHWYFGLAEATQLQALCNGCNGVWGAVCKTGAQTGHACSTMTAVNLYRAGIDYPICDNYNLEEMCEAARAITEIVTRKPCDPHEEIYGSQAFDIPYFMVSLPSCRYSIYQVLEKIGVKERAVRLNTLSMVSSIYHAMVYYFGEPERTGWNPQHCHKMHDAINNHLLTGLSRDYNSPLGLGHLYGLVSREKLPGAMVNIMMQDSNIPDTHPVVMDFIFRWNSLCELYETGEAPSHPAAQSKSTMFWGVHLVLEPRLESLPFEFFTADVMRNKVLEPIPSLFKLQVVNMLTNDERKIQGRKIPVISFFETMLRLKLFLQEADSLHVMGLVDDFCIRKNHDFFFGEDALWLKQMHNNERPKVATKVLLKQMKFYHKHYIHQGDTAISRCIEATAGRIDEKRSIPADMRRVFGDDRAKHLVHEIAEHGREVQSEYSHRHERFGTIVPSHESMLRALAQDDGEDKNLAKELSQEFIGTNADDNESDMLSSELLADEYIRHRRESLLVSDDDLLSSEDLATLEDDPTQPKSGRDVSIRRTLFGQEVSTRIMQERRRSKSFV